MSALAVLLRNQLCSAYLVKNHDKRGILIHENSLAVSRPDTNCWLQDNKSEKNTR
jgi:hypothetical protein